MSSDTATPPERALIEQPKASVVVFSSEQILATIEQLHACYDYCAAWKETTQEESPAEDNETAMTKTPTPRANDA